MENSPSGYKARQIARQEKLEYSETIINFPKQHCNDHAANRGFH
jgi:hypothetical protein